MPLELEVALAYFRSRPSRLVSAVSMLAIGGIALGVAALVVAMGLLSGYRSEIREKLLGANAEIVVYPLLPAGSEELSQLRRKLAGVARVRATASVVYQSGLAASASSPEGVDAVVKGIDAAEEARVSPEVTAYLPDAGRFLGTAPGQLPGVAIGIELARKLGARVGDRITLSVPDAAPGQPHFVPRTGRFRVARIFQSEFAEYDAQWVFCDRGVLRALSRMPGEANVVEVKLDTTAHLEEALSSIRAAAGEKYSVADTLSMNRSLFSALKVQQITLFLVIGLIVGVSTFNLVATLVMTVREKQRDIGVLSALGAEPRFFSRAFLWLGAMLGGAGVLAGVAFGALVCFLVTEFRLLSFPTGVAEIYFVSFIPFLVRPADLSAIVGSSTAVILFVSWLTALRAARVNVAEALRYE